MKNFGFGCMRLPMKNGEVDNEEFSKMIKTFFDSGFTYFDTAHGYLDGKSEKALKECLTSKYERDRYTLTNKLTVEYFQKEEDIRPFFEKQLELCGVEYFDYYLMHAQNAEFYKKYKRCRAYEIANELKDEGKIKHLGISFHDKAEVLDMILSEHPEVEVVQIQFNYVDYNDASIEGKKCYEVCKKYDKDVIIMEPVKGGSLVNLPKEASDILSSLGNGSNASYAIRFAASFDKIIMVLSGMSNVEQMNDNVSFMKDFRPLNEKEFEAIDKVCEIFKGLDLIPCTACHYCTAGCPKQIPIPDFFSCLNAKKQYKDWNSDWYYSVYAKDGSRAADCIKCKKCERVCPQHLKITELLTEVSKQFDH